MGLVGGVWHAGRQYGTHIDRFDKVECVKKISNAFQLDKESLSFNASALVIAAKSCSSVLANKRPADYYGSKAMKKEWLVVCRGDSSISLPTYAAMQAFNYR